MRQYFPQPYEHFGGNTIFEFDVLNYVTNAKLKGAAEQTLMHQNKHQNQILACLKAHVIKLVAYKLKIFLADLSRLSNLVDKNDLKRKFMINWLQQLMLLL